MTRLLALLARVEGFVAVTAYAVTCGLLLADVFSREVYAQSIWGAQKFAVFGTIIAGILGMSIAVGNNAHLRATFADRVLPWPWIERLGDLISAAIFATLAWYAADFVAEAIKFSDRAEVVNIPLWYFEVVFPYAFGSAGLRHLVFALQPAAKPSAAGEA